MSKDRRQAKKHKSNKETILHAAHELTEDTTNDTTKLKRTETKRKNKNILIFCNKFGMLMNTLTEGSCSF